jgi:hypothetical protein
MKTNWRELLESIPVEALGTKSTKSLDVLKRDETEKAATESVINMVNSVKSPPKPLGQFSNTPAKTVKSAKRHLDNLEAVLASRGISIAIDRQTGVALLLLKQSDREIVKDVADVYEPFEIGKLTENQHAEIERDLAYYERLTRAPGQSLKISNGSQETKHGRPLG